ncbi:MAG TPA: hypothetical protein VKI65_00520 [Gemmataceae bacterium]|nr:hypothetical protein [Gemmataceae bacterium]
MSRLEQPLNHQILWNTGDLILRAELDLLLKDNQGNWHAKTFRVDTASDMTTMPAHDARRLGLPIPGNPVPLRHEQTGLEIRSGYLRCQVVGMDQTEYAFPCFFLGDPGLPPDPNAPPATLPRYLLGLSGVVDKVRILFDGGPGPGAPYGYVIVEKR